MHVMSVHSLYNHLQRLMLNAVEYPQLNCPSSILLSSVSCTLHVEIYQVADY